MKTALLVLGVILVVFWLGYLRGQFFRHNRARVFWSLDENMFMAFYVVVPTVGVAFILFGIV